MILENFGRFAVLESIAEFKTEKRDCGVSVENLEILNQVLCHCGVITIICHQFGVHAKSFPSRISQASQSKR